MNIENMVRGLAVALLVVASFAQPVHSQQSVEVMIPKGWSALTVPFSHSALRTVSDVARVTSSPIVIWQESGAFRLFEHGMSAAPNVRGNTAYFVSCPTSRAVALTGIPWSAGQLAVASSPSGMIMAVNVRPSQTSLSDFAFQTGLRGILRFWPLERRWEAVVLPGIMESQEGFATGGIYGLLPRGRIENAIILPNTNIPPRALVDGLPIAATSGTALPLYSTSTDPDDVELAHHWAMIGPDGSRKEASGRFVEIAAHGFGTAAVELDASDGLADSRIVQEVSILSGQQPTGVEALGFGLNEVQLRSFGLSGTLSDLRGMLEYRPLLGYWIRHTSDPQQVRLPDSSEIIGGFREIAISSPEVLATTNPYRQRMSNVVPAEMGEVKVLPRNVTFSVDLGFSPTSPADADILAELSVRSGPRGAVPTTFHYFAHTPWSITTTAANMKEEVDPRHRSWSTTIRDRIKRFAPVNLLKRKTRQVKVRVEPIHPEVSPDGRTVVLLVHGYDFRSEFCVGGADALSEQQQWRAFRGIHPKSPGGFSKNIRDLEPSFAFYLVHYPTTDSLNESAEGIAQELQRTLFANGADRQMVLIGYSMGGLVCRALQGKQVNSRPIGERVKYLITIGTPHHGAGIATALSGNYFEHKFLFDLDLWGVGDWYIPDPMRPLLDYGCVPPSEGLRALGYDATLYWIRNNPELTAFNASDPYRDARNVITLAGGSSLGFIPTLRLESIRVFFAGGMPEGWSDGIVGRVSSLPEDLFGSDKGSVDSFFGWREDGTLDRIAYYDGLDHERLVMDPEVIAGLHTFLSQVALRSNRPPVDRTPTLIEKPAMAPASEPSTLKITGAESFDPDGHTIEHQWTLGGTLPHVSAALLDDGAVAPTLSLRDPTNALLWHTVRDGRGGISVQLVTVYIPELRQPTYPCSRDRRISIVLQTYPNDPGIHWSGFGLWSCVSENEFQFYLDPTDPATKVPKHVWGLSGGYYTKVYDDYRWWYDRPIYAVYQGPEKTGVAGMPIVWSNVATARLRLAPTFSTP